MKNQGNGFGYDFLAQFFTLDLLTHLYWLAIDPGNKQTVTGTDRGLVDDGAMDFILVWLITDNLLFSKDNLLCLFLFLEVHEIVVKEYNLFWIN